MRYLDICSGISAPTMAWKPLGWRAMCFAEIEAAPRAVLSHHYPDVPLRGDFTEIDGTEYGSVDLLVGGTPCQSFSVAGLRGGLADERGNLALEYLRLADRARPRWLVWENVPGVLSSDGGRDFGTFLGGLAQLGCGFAYAVLDAQHFGVPQRRRRVFVVGHLGDWRRAAAVLFERHSLQGHPPPRRQAGEGSASRSARSVAIRGRDGTPQAELGDEVANAILTPNGGRGGVGVGAVLETCGTLTPGAHPGSYNGQDAYTGHLIGVDFQNSAMTGDIAGTLLGEAQRRGNVGLGVAHSLRAEGFDASEDGTGRGTPLVPVAFQSKASASNSMNPSAVSPAIDVGKSDGPAFTAKDHGADAGELAPTLRAGGHSGSHANAGVMPAVAFSPLRYGESNQDTMHSADDVLNTLPGGTHDNGGHFTKTFTGSAVRRLTPRECERLQGFPDDFTLVPHRGKPMADGPRYKMLGNSMAVPVLRWIGERIEAVEAIAQAERRAA